MVPITPLAVRRRVVPVWGRYNRFLLQIFCDLRVQVQGSERIPPHPYVVLSKHQSAWETVVFQALFPGALLVLKQSLLNIPFFGWALMATGQIAIDRSQGIKAMRSMTVKCQEAFEAGCSVIIFPEGTRMAPGEVGKYNPGGVGVAVASGVPILPVAHDAGRYWGRRAFLKRPGTIQLCIGAPIATAHLTKGDRKILNQQVQTTIEGMMAAIDGKKTDGTMG